MANKHIAIVANTTWNIYNFRLNIIRKLVDKGCKITVIAPVDEYIRYREVFPEIEHIGLRYLDRDGINPVKDALLIRELYKVYRAVAPDLILHYTVKPNIYGGIAGHLLGVPSIAVVTGLGYPFIHNGLVRKVTKALYWFSNTYHKYVIFENEDDLQLFINEKLVSRDQGHAVKGCGVDTVYYSPMTGTRSDDKVVFTFIGRMLYDKGVKEFVDAAEQVRRIYAASEFWLLGELDRGNPSSVKEKDLLEWVEAPNINYLGSRKDVRNIIAASDCIVLPSYREGFSRVLMEAMSMSKPVITTDAPGCREAVVDGESGIIVPVGNTDVLAQAFLEFIALTKEQRAHIGQQARYKAISEFDQQKIADEVYDILEKAMST